MGPVRLSQTRPIPRSPDGDKKRRKQNVLAVSRLFEVERVFIESREEAVR